MTKNKTTFDKQLGVKIVNHKKGYCKVRLNVKPQHLNHGGIVHGGVLATLCDVALAGAVATVMNKEEWCVTIQLNIEYMDPAFLGDTLFGFGKLVRRGKTLAFVEGGIETKNKRKITKAHGIWFIKLGPSKKIRIKKAIKQIE